MLLLGNYITKKCLLYKFGKLWYDIVNERNYALTAPEKINTEAFSGGIRRGEYFYERITDMDQKERQLYLIKYLLSEDGKYENFSIPESNEERFRLLRSLMNIRPPKPVPKEFIAVQDEFLKEKIFSKGVTDIADLVPTEDGLYLWKGDITTLKCGAVVNAANSQMLGCFQPCHGCIDNAIHTFAGIQLRLECSDIMYRQG